MSKRHGDIRHIHEEGSFLHFYHGEFQDMLETVIIPDQRGKHGPITMDGASWDRRAAWLLWAERKGIRLAHKIERDDDDIL